MSIEAILKPILAKLTQLSKHQHNFLCELFSVLLGKQGRNTFENMARFSRFTELTFRRHFSRSVDWLGFNMACVDWTNDEFIGLFDCSFIPKSGSATCGLASFWSSCAGKVQRGLEISVLACVNTRTKDCFALQADQTIDQKATAGEKTKLSRMAFYVQQLRTCLPKLTQIVYWVGDGYYAKKEVFDTLTSLQKHLITRLRTDASLLHLYTKPRASGQRGAPRLYDGKVSFSDLSRWESAGTHPQHEQVALYTVIAYCRHFKRNLRVVLLVDTRRKKYVLLASSDVDQSATQLVWYYHLRFQIEFLFRDAKTFTGLTHCQARSESKLAYHFNASLSGVNVARLALSQDASLGGSMNALVRRLAGERIWEVIYGQLSEESRVLINKPDAASWQFWSARAA